METASTWWFLASILSAPLAYAAFRVTSKLGMIVVIVLASGLSFLMTLAALQEAFFLKMNSVKGRRMRRDANGLPTGSFRDVSQSCWYQLRLV
jgi:hypothetical protein